MGMDGAREPSNVRTAAAMVGPDTVEAARLGFHRAQPNRSARRVFTVVQLAVFGLLGWGFYAAFRADASLSGAVLRVVAYVVFAAAILWRLVAAGSLKPIRSRVASPAHWPAYTILCPLYREADVVFDLVSALERLDYPGNALQIQLLVEADDAETMAAALAAARSPNVEVVLVPKANPRTKPKALNIGLARATGAYVVVYDAEDRPHPLQLRAALAAFEDGDEKLACVQAPLVIDNAGASWIARQFAAEYAIQFSEILPLLARLKLPLPLGGSSNHFRTEALRAAGGWDPYNVCEDRSNFASKLNRFRTTAFHIPFVSQSCASAA